MKTPQPIPKRIEDKISRIKHLEEIEKHLKERAQVLQKEAKKFEYERQSLRKEIQNFMEDNNFTKIRGSNYIVDYVAGNSKVIVKDERLIPAEYRTVTVTLNRRKLLADKATLSIPGVVFEETKAVIIKQIK